MAGPLAVEWLGLRLRDHWPKPKVLPEQRARSFASAVGRTIATKVLKVYGGPKPPVFTCLMRRVACLMGDCAHAKSASTESQHLGHERQSIDTSLLVKRGQDLLL